MHAPAPWRVRSSRVVVSDRWIHLRADDCEDVDGQVIAPFYVLEPAEWISLLALNDDGDAVVVEEYRHGAGVVALGTVGGAVEQGEQPIDAACRELREETGNEAARVVELGATWANFGNHSNRVHHFLALGCTRVGAQILDESEAITVHVLPFEDLGDRLTQSYHQLTWFKARDWLS